MSKGKKRMKSLPLSLPFCLSPIGWRVWKWNVILRVKHQTASSCWAVRSPTGQRMDHGLLSVCLCVCFCGCAHERTRVRDFVSICLRVFHSVSCVCDMFFYECSLSVSWSFIPTVPYSLCVCAHMHMLTCAQPVNRTDISLPSSQSICLLTDWG